MLFEMVVSKVWVEGTNPEGDERIYGPSGGRERLRFW